MLTEINNNNYSEILYNCIPCREVSLLLKTPYNKVREHRDVGLVLVWNLHLVGQLSWC